ncbi:hypothetical protein, partial [Actinoplanes sp. NPDC049265]|uniref:hypothetical protein n=1 Tax=Actinoplanes sp. NPDC049265 TaxID=3363902 RepID=UPI0037148336
MTITKLLIQRSLRLIIPRPLLNLNAIRVIQHMLITSRRNIIIIAILKRRMTSIRRRLTNKVTILGVLSGPLLIRQRIMTITKLLIQRSLRLIIPRPLLNLNAIRVIQHMLITSRRNIIIIAILKRRMTSIRRRLTNEMTILRVLGRPLLIRQRIMTITKLLIQRSLRLITTGPLLNLNAIRVIQHMLITGCRDIVLAPILERRMSPVRRRLTNKVTILRVLGRPLLIRQRITTITKLLIQRSLRLITTGPLLDLNAVGPVQNMLITSRRNVIIIAILERRMSPIRRRLTNKVTILRVLGRPLLIRQRITTITKLL